MVLSATFRRWLVLLLLLLPAVAASAQSQRATPYWVSISASEAMMRAGPGIGFPARWKYVRPDLPLRVLQVRQDWRKVEDPQGEQGWVKANLLSERRTAIIVGEIAVLRAAPDRAARVNWRAEPGVVGAIAHCAAGWCEFEVHGQAGYVEVAHIWGVDPDERID